MTAAVTGADISAVNPNGDYQRALRDVFGRFATGVAVVSAIDMNGQRVGLTINSFSSVSLDPPLVLFSVSCTAPSLKTLISVDRFAINVLAEDQHQISHHFARPSEDKWQGIETRVGQGGCLLIGCALAHFECTPFATHQAGDHVILIGSVIRYEAGRGAPLVFYQGKYHALTTLAVADEMRKIQ